MNYIIVDLFHKYISGSITDTESDLAIEFILEGNHELELDEAISKDADLLLGNPVEGSITDNTKDAIFDKISQTIENNKISKKRRTVGLWTKWGIAAAMVIMTGIAYYFNGTKNEVIIIPTLSAFDAPPGSDKAVLTLSNGKKIQLDKAKVGILALQGGISVVKQSKGSLHYIDKRHRSLGENKIETPRGGRFQVALPDGSQVWLNAASSLEYPVSFGSSKQRTVRLSGEGYFEIARDPKHPFVVIFNDKEVKVLGTHFNINSYENEPDSKTTLLEGSIQLESIGVKKTLKPGQQATIQNKDGKIIIKPNDVETSIAWKKGIFKFDDTDLRTIMNQIERWYNVEVEFEPGVENVKFSGGTLMSNNLSEVLKVLEINGLKFKFKDKKLILLK